MHRVHQLQHPNRVETKMMILKWILVNLKVGYGLNGWFFEKIILFFLQIENPVLSEDYLQAHNADILAGPIELASCMDLNEDGGLVTLTSPKLFKTKSRNFLVHIKTMADVSKNGHGKTRGKLMSNM